MICFLSFIGFYVQHVCYLTRIAYGSIRFRLLFDDSIAMHCIVDLFRVDYRFLSESHQEIVVVTKRTLPSVMYQSCILSIRIVNVMGSSVSFLTFFFEVKHFC